MTEKTLSSSSLKRFKGVAVNAGQVVAPVCLYSAARRHSLDERYLSSDAEVEKELTRLDKAVEEGMKELDEVADRVEKGVGKAEAEIFVTQKHIMGDPEILNEIRKRVTADRRNLEWVVSDVYRDYEKKFSQLDNEYFRERSGDFSEIRHRLLDRLANIRPGFVCRTQPRCTRGNDRVIVAEELTAQMMAHMQLQNVRGIVTERGGVSSHAAIIAHSLGVPAVSGARGVFHSVDCGDMMLVDGDTGEVIVEPDEETIRGVIPSDEVDLEKSCPLVTPAGMEVLANASLMEDVDLAARFHADGIGLFRTEIAFMRADRLLHEDDQVALYTKVVNRMGDRPVTFRLLDIGGDKALPFLQIEKEDNPSLGWRGARFLLGNREILASQVRALVRLARAAPVRILYPMIVDAEQVRELNEAVLAIVDSEGGNKDQVKVGAMFEVPSACVQAEQIMRNVDFASVGSNDLIQYLFAVDRNNSLVSSDYNPEHPALWETLSRLAQASRTTETPLSVCGEMAGRAGMAARFLDVGISSMSVAPRLIPKLRNEMSAYAGRQAVTAGA